MTNCICVGKHVPLPNKDYLVGFKDEVVSLCPTSAENLNMLMERYSNYKGRPPGSELKHYSIYVQRLAEKLWYNEAKEGVET